MSWYFVTAGLSLWAIDHFIRWFLPITQIVKVHSFQPSEVGDLTILTYTVSNLTHVGMTLKNWFVRTPSKALSFQMGQYVFINVPAISTIAWHPFSISSTPHDSVTSHHIKCRGSNEWTGQLLALAKVCSYRLLIVCVCMPVSVLPCI